MPMFDFRCENGHEIEEVVPDSKETVFCPECGKKMEIVWRKTPPILTTIIPTYPGCKAQKAGYVHTHHAPHDATRVQSGYGGSQGPK